MLFDSDNGRDEGKDYSGWRDVELSLQGNYGARTSRDLPDAPGESALYVAAPIYAGNDVIGVLTVAKPTRNVNTFVEATQRKITFGAIVTVLVVEKLVPIVSTGFIAAPDFKLTGPVNAAAPPNASTSPDRTHMRMEGRALWARAVGPSGVPVRVGEAADAVGRAADRALHCGVVVVAPAARPTVVVGDLLVRWWWRDGGGYLLWVWGGKGQTIGFGNIHHSPFEILSID